MRGWRARSAGNVAALCDNHGTLGAGRSQCSRGDRAAPAGTGTRSKWVRYTIEQGVSDAPAKPEEVGREELSSFSASCFSSLAH